jgi:hypothetical protein
MRASVLHPVTTERQPTQRSRATNGKTLFAAGGDQRGPWARRLRDIFSLHLSDLGGQEAVSEAERSLARRAAVLTVELERLEARFAVDGGLPGDLDLYQRTAGNLRRLLESLGMQRRPRNIGPSLGQLMLEDIAERQREAEATAQAVAVTPGSLDTGSENECASGLPRANGATSSAEDTETPYPVCPAEGPA